jgi:hypothetical protein
LVPKGPLEKNNKCRKTTIAGKHQMCQEHEGKQQKLEVIYFTLRPTKIINKNKVT